MFYRNEILLVDKDGDVLTIGGNPIEHANGERRDIPVLSIKHGVSMEELAEGYVLNSGTSQSVFVSAEDFKRILPRLIREFYGPNATFTIEEN